METQLGWARKLGGTLWISKASQTVLVKLMESQICHQCAGSGGGGLIKGRWPLIALIPDASVSPSIPLVPFKLLP